MITPESLARSGTEDGHQSALFCYAREAAKTNDNWELLYAIPNGGKRGVATAARMKATGAKRGFPDIGLPVQIKHGMACTGECAVTEFAGLFIEMKKPGTQGTAAGDPRDDQKWWHSRLREQGYAVAVCYHYEHAIKVITDYLNGKFTG